MPLSPARLGLAASIASALAAFALWQPAASAGQPRQPASDDPVQVVADIVLIESECHGISVDYGKLFAYAERNGISPVDIMPLGERRPAFDAAYRRRAREARGPQLCGALAEARDATVPGVFSSR